MELSYKKSFSIPGNGLRPEFIMQCLQKTAEQHAAQMGFSRDTLLSEGNCVWMIARSSYSFSHGLPNRGKLTVETWPSGADAVQSYRSFYFHQDGQIIGEAFQSWLLVDIEKRRILPTKLFPQLAQMKNPDRPGVSRLRHIVLPELSPVMQVTVCPEDIDINGHMNNARYLSYAMLPTRLQTASAVRIDYERELTAADTVTLFACEQDGVWYVSGRLPDGLSAFRAEIHQ